MKRISLLLALILALAAPALAQVATGTIAGTVRDEQGGVLPGVTITLAGSDRTSAFTTETDGRFRFLNLPPGSYRLTVELPGFSRVVREDLAVSVGTNIDLPFTLKVATVSETITVKGETPIVDAKAMGTATNFTQAELEKIPTSRDPWALLRTVPGVVVDRVNIAGNETGQQSNFQSKGTRPQDAVWTMDGVVITDMAAIGASPTYFNYDNFDEIQVSTSGQDLKQPTGGVGLNFVVRRGTNQYRGNARGFFTNDSLEASNVPDELANRPTNPVTPETADHNDQISDYTIDFGGPIVRDKAWFFGSWANQDIRLVRQSGNLIDRTVLKTFSAKGNWQATSKDNLNVLWFLGAKEKFGRSPGRTGIADVATSTWDQGGAYIDGKPHGLTKIEDNHVFGANLFMSGKYAYYNTGFGLVPKGGLDMNSGESQVLGQSFGSYQQSLNLRPQHTVNVDTNYFSNAIGAAHDIKFGGGWRRVTSTIGTLWPGNMIRAFENSASDRRARLYREGLGSDRMQYFHLYAGDTISLGRMTIDVGARYDRQWGAALASNTRPNEAFPNLVPGMNFTGYDTPFTWNDISPKVGLTYALDEAHRTLLRASFSRNAGQLESSIVGYSNPTANVGYIEYPWQDLNGDHLAQPNEVRVDLPFLSFAGGFDPANPTSTASVDEIDPDLKAPHTMSFVAGVDRELAANLAVSVAYTWTKTTDTIGNFTNYYTPWIGVELSDYAPGTPLTGTLPDGSAYNVPIFIANTDVIDAAGGGTLMTNHPGYHSQYNGIEASLTKRYSNNWMARIGAAYNAAQECFTTPVNELGNPTRTDTTPLADCGPFTVRSGGSGAGDIFIHAKWQMNANALYTFPHDINVAANLFGRQGYPFPVYRNAALGYEGTRRVLVSPELDTFRLDNLWNLDLRGSKTFRFADRSVEVIADLFNVMNANTELVRNRNTGSAAFNALQQNLSPRILRFGVRLAF